MNQIKFRARVKQNGKPFMFYQEDQYLISFLRRVTMFIDLDSDKPRIAKVDPRTATDVDVFNGGVHESYLPAALESYLDQWIGLTDKKGKDIFFGDIVSTPDGMAEIHWCSDPQHLGVVASQEGMELEYWWPECEVVGNTYENPELIKV